MIVAKFGYSPKRNWVKNNTRSPRVPDSNFLRRLKFISEHKHDQGTYWFNAVDVEMIAEGPNSLRFN